MTLRTCLLSAMSLVFAIVIPSLIEGREPRKEIETVSFYALKKANSDELADRIAFQLVEGRVYGVWNVRHPTQPNVAVSAYSPSYRTTIDAPFWVMDQIVFHPRNKRPVQFLVADWTTTPPGVALKTKQVDGFRWKAEVLKSERRNYSVSKFESSLMYIGGTDPAGTEYWLGFDDTPVRMQQDGLEVELRELILKPKKQYRFQYQYRRYSKRDDEGK